MKAAFARKGMFPTVGSFRVRMNWQLKLYFREFRGRTIIDFSCSLRESRCDDVAAIRMSKRASGGIRRRARRMSGALQWPCAAMLRLWGEMEMLSYEKSCGVCGWGILIQVNSCLL